MQLQKMEDGLRDHLKSVARKLTKQRRQILDIFAGASSHLTIEELYNKTRQQHPNIGIATVYRTVKLLCELGLAKGFRHSDGNFRYELEQEEHDHLICVKCGRYIEDTAAEYSKVHDELAQRNGFKILYTRVELYGVCQHCL